MLRRLFSFVPAALSLAVAVSAAVGVAHAEPRGGARAKAKQVLVPSSDPFVGPESTSAFGGSFGGWASAGVVAEARRWVGTNPTGRRSLWCARFMNFVLERAGHRGTGSDMARSFSKYGRRLSGPQVGAIAIMSRRGRGGHVGVVSRIDEKGNPVIISGNHNNRVAETTYPRGRIYAYVMPGF